MGSKASILLREEEIEEIRNETGFSANQIVRLYSRFTALDKTGSGTLSREGISFASLSKGGCKGSCFG